MDAARRRRELLRALTEQREEQKRSQTTIAAAMETSQSFVARLESTAADTKISTVDRYAESLGFMVQYHLIPVAKASGSPAVVETVILVHNDITLGDHLTPRHLWMPLA
jgi:predicted transcriptional regulator